MQIARHWRLKGPRYRLEGARLADGRIVFPPPAHGNGETVVLAGRGTIESFSVIASPADGYDEQLVVALVRLDEGPLITTQLADAEPEQLSIGMPVQAVTRKLRELGPDGMIVYGFKFRPVL